MKTRFSHYSAILSILLGVITHVEAKPLKVFILAGQSNMEGHARIETFDYIGDDPATAPLLKMMRGADGKPAVAENAWISYLIRSVKQMAHLLKVKNKNSANKDGTMTDVEQKEYLKKYKAEIITPEEAAKWTRGASNTGYHYLGCAKTFALMGKHFAEANLEMLKAQKR